MVIVIFDPRHNTATLNVYGDIVNIPFDQPRDVPTPLFTVCNVLWRASGYQNEPLRYVMGDPYCLTLGETQKRIYLDKSAYDVINKTYADLQRLVG